MILLTSCFNFNMMAGMAYQLKCPNNTDMTCKPEYCPDNGLRIITNVERSKIHFQQYLYMLSGKPCHIIINS